MSTRRLVRRNGIREEPAGSAGSRVRELVTQTQKPLGPEWGSTVGQGTGQSEARSHPRDIIPGRHTGFPSCRKVAENPEGIPSTALVRVDPVLSCRVGGRVRAPEVLDPRCSLPHFPPTAPTSRPHICPQTPSPPFPRQTPRTQLWFPSSPYAPSGSATPPPSSTPRLANGGGRSTDTLTLVQRVAVGLHTCLCV